MAKRRVNEKYLINKKEIKIEPTVKSTAKNYEMTVGDCNNCCLSRECKANGKGIKSFLLGLKILCEHGKCLKIKES